MRPLWLFILISLFSLPEAFGARAPELSADNPIEFDARTRTMIAAGNAVFSHQDVIVMADEIRFRQEEDLVLAEGNVRITQAGMRMVTNKLQYNLRSRQFTSGPFRAGFPPVFVSGDSFSGTVDDILFSAPTLFYGEPMTFTPSLTAQEVRLLQRERIRVDGPRFGTGGVGWLPVPEIDSPLQLPPVSLSLEGGFRERLGLYLRSEWLYPANQHLRLGANLDAYTGRGVLLGPLWSWQRQESGLFQEFEGSVGWIYDAGRRGVDVRERSIRPNRYFVDIAARHEDGSFEGVLRSTVLGDSEVQRDFRPGRFSGNQEPDTFAEFSWQSGSWLLSAFARVQPNNAFNLVERLPELRADYLLSPLATTGLWHGAHFSALSYRQVDLVAGAPAGPDFLQELDQVRGPVRQRLDALYRLHYPVHLAPWLTMTPHLQGRWTWYDKTLAEDGTLTGPSLQRTMGSVGVDLVGRFWREWDYRNQVWGVDGLRHIVQPVAYYRWHPGGSRHADRIVAIDQGTYQPMLPDINLETLRAVDQLSDLHVLRFGVENLLQTRAGEGRVARNLAEFNVYQDLLFSADPGQPEWDAFYLQTRLQPARWLRLNFEQKVLTESLRAENFRVRASIVSARTWQVDLFADYLDGVIEQYAAQGFYQFHPRWAVTVAARYDARLDKWTRQRYGLRQRLGNSWFVEYGLSFNSGSEREDDVSLSLRVHLITF